MKSTIDDTIILSEAVQDYLTRLNNDPLNVFLAEWPQPPYNIRSLNPRSLPVLACLTKAAPKSSTASKTLITMLTERATNLPWGQTYSPEDFGTRFLENYGWTELIGQRGPIASQQMACGFLVLGLEVEYPLHSHEAEEIYVPLTRSTLWKRGGEAWQDRNCDVPIQHASWESHGMRTRDTPLVAVYLWRGGNLVQKSRILR